MAKRADVLPSKPPPVAERAKHSVVAASAPASFIEVSRPKPKDDASPTMDEPVSEDLQAIFGENLRAARLKGGLKQSDVAERSGLSQQRLSLIESGHINLTLKTMTRLAEVVGCSLIAMLQKAHGQPRAR